MNDSSSRFLDELLASGKVQLSDETPASCILACTCTSYDVADSEEYEGIIGKEITLEELLCSVEAEGDNEQPGLTGKDDESK